MSWSGPSAAALVCAVLMAATVWLSRPLAVTTHGSGGSRNGVLLLGAAAVVVTVTGVVPWRLSAPVLVAGCGAAGLASVRTRRRRAAAVARTGAQVQELCELLGAGLAAGLPVDKCLTEAASVWPPMRRAVSIHAMGGAVPDLLRELAAEPGAGDLRLVAAAWQVTSRSGSGLADSLTEVSETLRAREATRRVVRSELASARSTARLMVVLPVFTLLMGSGVGGDPVRFLVGTPVGLGCLAVGLLLVVLGLRWIEAISAGVEATS